MPQSSAAIARTTRSVTPETFDLPSPAGPENAPLDDARFLIRTSHGLYNVLGLEPYGLAGVEDSRLRVSYERAYMDVDCSAFCQAT